MNAQSIGKRRRGGRAGERERWEERDRGTVNQVGILGNMKILCNKNQILCNLATHVFVPEVHLVLLYHAATRCRAVVDDHVHVDPQFELSLPVGDGGERDDDKERAADTEVQYLL